MVEYYNAKKLAPIDWVANEKNLIKLVKWIKEYSDPVNIAALTTLCQFAWPRKSTSLFVSLRVTPYNLLCNSGIDGRIENHDHGRRRAEVKDVETSSRGEVVFA